MISQFRELAGQGVVNTQVCVVGAGAAGITLANRLARQGKEVLVLESGDWKEDPRTQALYAGEVVDERLHSPPDRYRQRRFGGSTTIWGGRCMPLDAIDLEARDFVPHSGWPFGLEALLPYYPEANRLCEAGRFAYLSETAFSRSAPPLVAGFESPDFSINTLERFSVPTDFARRYGAQLAESARVRVLLCANVTAIRLDENGTRVASLEVRDFTGASLVVRADCFVLAVGGLETPRLLLSNRDVQPAGIGNEFDVVGRYYMCHIAGTIGRIEIHGPLDRVHYGYHVSDEGVYCRNRFALRPESQYEHKLGNFVARLHHPRIADPAHGNAVLSSLYLAKFIIPYEYGKRLHNGDAVSAADWMRHARNVLFSPLEAAGFAWHMLRDRKLANRKFPSIIIRPRQNLYSLDFHAEQQPNASSRVQISEQRDEFGVPRLKVDWRYTVGDVDTVRRSLALLARAFVQTGVGRFDYAADSVELEMTRYGAYGGHHIGTARMGSDRRTSVVDANCKVHGVGNLFVAGAATFPTSSQANPTLTVVALSLRLADHLVSQIGAAA